MSGDMCEKSAGKLHAYHWLPIIVPVASVFPWQNFFSSVLLLIHYCNCSEFKSKPNQKDLARAYLLLQSIVTSDPKLQASPVSTSSYLISFRNRLPYISVIPMTFCMLSRSLYLFFIRLVPPALTSLASVQLPPLFFSRK